MSAQKTTQAQTQTPQIAETTATVKVGKGVDRKTLIIIAGFALLILALVLWRRK